MRVNLPKKSHEKLEGHESEFAWALNRIKNPDAERHENIPVGINHLDHYVEIDDEYGFTEEEVKEAYKKFKHVHGYHLPKWAQRMQELFVKEDKTGLTEEEEAELRKLERKDRKRRMGLLPREEL